LKRLYGHPWWNGRAEEAAIEFANPQPQILRLARNCGDPGARARELLYFVRESLRQGGVVDALGAGSLC